MKGPCDKRGRVLKVGDFVYVKRWNLVGEISAIYKESWYRWALHLKTDETENAGCIYSELCEWITKRRRIREQKLFMLKLENP